MKTMRPWHVLVIVVLLFGFLVIRVLGLEDRVELLYKMAEVRSATAVKEDGEAEEPDAGAGRPAEQQPEQREDRLRGLEERIARLETRAQNPLQVQQAPTGEPNRALADMVKSDGFDEYVRSVMRNEVDRLRDERLLKHRDALVENRTRAVREFAKQAGLSAHQEAAILAILEEEADKMVDLLKSQDMVDDQPKAMNTWSDMLKQTDEEARDILNAAQMTIFLQLRRAEQQVLMPWLPKAK